jgi:hypothetical protein
MVVLEGEALLPEPPFELAGRLGSIEQGDGADEPALIRTLNGFPTLKIGWHVILSPLDLRWKWRGLGIRKSLFLWLDRWENGERRTGGVWRIFLVNVYKVPLESSLQRRIDISQHVNSVTLSII